MNIGKAFSYVFEDPQWVTKILFGALFSLLSLVLVGIPFLLGYSVQIVRNVRRGDANPLPEWSNLGALFTDGLKLFVVIFVYALPIIILSCCTQLIQVIGSGTASGSGNSDASSALVAVAVAISLAFWCLQIIYSIIYYIVIPVIVIRYAQSGNIGEALQFGRVWSFAQAVMGPLLIVFLLGIVTSFIGSLGAIVCFIGVFATSAYQLFVNSHLYGQLWQQHDMRAPNSIA